VVTLKPSVDQSRSVNQAMKGRFQFSRALLTNSTDSKSITTTEEVKQVFRGLYSGV